MSPVHLQHWQFLHYPLLCLKVATKFTRVIPFTFPILSKTIYVEWPFNLPLQQLLYCDFCAGVLFDLLINKTILKSPQLTSSLSISFSLLPNKKHQLPRNTLTTQCTKWYRLSTHTLACLSSIKKWECNKPQLVQQINADESFDSW